MTDFRREWWVGCLRVVATDPAWWSSGVTVWDGPALVWSGEVTLGSTDVETHDWPVALAMDAYGVTVGQAGPWSIGDSLGCGHGLVDGAREVAMGSRDLGWLGVPEDAVVTLEVRQADASGPDYVIKTADGYRVGISTRRPDRLTGILPMVRAALAAAGAV